MVSIPSRQSPGTSIRRAHPGNKTPSPGKSHAVLLVLGRLAPPCLRADLDLIALAPRQAVRHSLLAFRKGGRPPFCSRPAFAASCRDWPSQSASENRSAFPLRVFRRIMPSGSLIRSRRYRKTAVSNLVPLSFLPSAYAYASQDGHPQPKQRPTMPTAPPHSGHTRSGSGGVSTPANGSKLGFVIAAPYPRVLFRRTCLSTCRSRCARGR